MKQFVEGEDRSQSTLFPEHLDDPLAEDNPARVIDVFVDELDLSDLGRWVRFDICAGTGWYQSSTSVRGAA
jgi:hypothetical protein